ncbi:hypothetical protein [Qipengyuania sp. MTN3-11]|uniref:hypothetical protein n=1 Tax=Qipengyuania sp. MTN3-11 TaxID=3056557 RepID=UPI0036F1AF3F
MDGPETLGAEPDASLGELRTRLAGAFETYRRSLPREVDTAPAPSAVPTPSVSLARIWERPAAASTPVRSSAFVDQISKGEPVVHVAQVDAGRLGESMAMRFGQQKIATIAFQVDGDRGIILDVAQIMEVLKTRLSPERFASLRATVPQEQFVSVELLALSGVPIRYDPVYDELVMADAAG